MVIPIKIIGERYSPPTRAYFTSATCAISLFMIMGVKHPITISSGIWLIAFRFLQGVGSGIFQHNGASDSGIKFSSEKSRTSYRNFRSFGLYRVSGRTFCWRNTYAAHRVGSVGFAATILGFVSTIIAFVSWEKDVSSPKSEAKTKVDGKGTIVFMLGLTALVYSSSLIPSVAGWILIIAGIVLLAIFSDDRKSLGFSPCSTPNFTPATNYLPIPIWRR